MGLMADIGSEKSLGTKTAFEHDEHIYQKQKQEV